MTLNPMLTNISSSKYTISNFCKDLLKKRFSLEPNKQELIDSSDKLNFACPYCGDSKKDSFKKRGNLYLATQKYKCYNDGCSVLVPLNKFVSHFAKKYNLSIPALVLEEEPKYTPQTSIKKKAFLIEFLINRQIGEKLLSLQEVVDRFSLIPAKDAKPGSPVDLFIKKRHLDKIESLSKSCFFDSNQDKFYIFNLDLRSNRILGLAIRKVNDSSPGLRYNLKNYSEFKDSGLTNNLSNDLILELDQLNDYFNLLNIDFKKPILITEGQIDSLFLMNGMATSGVSKGKSILGTLISKSNARIIFDNDSAGKKESLKLLKEGYSVFMWNKLIYDLKKEYPFAKKTLSEIKDVNDLFSFLDSVNQNYTIAEFNSLVIRYFSNNPFDMLFV